MTEILMFNEKKSSLFVKCFSNKRGNGEKRWWGFRWPHPSLHGWLHSRYDTISDLFICRYRHRNFIFRYRTSLESVSVRVTTTAILKLNLFCLLSLLQLLSHLPRGPVAQLEFSWELLEKNCSLFRQSPFLTHNFDYHRKLNVCN